MRYDYPLTKKEVKIYRELYYLHYKPLYLKFRDLDIVKTEMAQILNSHGWSWRIFNDYRSIDIFQRLVFEHSHDISSFKPMTSNEDSKVYDPNYGALILKDSSLSESDLTVN